MKYLNAGSIPAALVVLALSSVVYAQTQTQTNQPANKHAAKPAKSVRTGKAAAHSAATPSPSQGIQPYQSQTIQPYHATEIQPVQARPVQPVQSTPIRPVESTPVQPVQSKPIQPAGSTPVRPGYGSAANPNRDGSAAGLIGTFGLSVPGVAYVVDNTAANTRTLFTSAGAATRSAVRINPDHTYDWNSVWDGRVIRGHWTEQNGGILLVHGQEGRDWLLRRKDGPSGKAVVTLWNQDSIWYDGTPLN